MVQEQIYKTGLNVRYDMTCTNICISTEFSEDLDCESSKIGRIFTDFDFLNNSRQNLNSKPLLNDSSCNSARDKTF